MHAENIYGVCIYFRRLYPNIRARAITFLVGTEMLVTLKQSGISWLECVQFSRGI